MNPTFVIIPGWHSSGPDHWQQHWWRTLPGSILLLQDDWRTPRREDWVQRLDDVLAALNGPVVLVAHSLGCVTVAHWAQRHRRDNVVAALLVAPADVERPDAAEPLRAFAPLPVGALPFPALLVGSETDRAAALGRARLMASLWETDFLNLGAVGHINVAAGFHQWEQGKQLLSQWLQLRLGLRIAGPQDDADSSPLPRAWPSACASAGTAPWAPHGQQWG